MSSVVAGRLRLSTDQVFLHTLEPTTYGDVGLGFAAKRPACETSEHFAPGCPASNRRRLLHQELFSSRTAQRNSGLVYRFRMAESAPNTCGKTTCETETSAEQTATQRALQAIALT